MLLHVRAERSIACCRSLLIAPFAPSPPSRQIFRAINPKAVYRNELYGYLHPHVCGCTCWLAD